MAQYLILIYGQEQAWNDWTPEQEEANGAGHRAFNAEAGDAVLGGKQLESVSQATSIRSDLDGGFLVSDGPFTEAKEAVGGYYLIEAPDIAEAIRLAKLLPEVSASTSGVEIRPVVMR